jgi:hypothetical protein
VESEFEGIFSWSRSREEFSDGVGVGTDSDINLKSYLDTPTPEP